MLGLVGSRHRGDNAEAVFHPNPFVRRPRAHIMAQLGIVTYNIAKDWDLPTILKKLEALKYQGVELRTTHAHKVEINLTSAQRQEVRKRFEDSPVVLAGLGSAFEYHSA